MKYFTAHLEGFGLILLLLSFGWQMLEQDLSNLSSEVDKYQTHEKLDHLYNLIADMYSTSESNRSETNVMANFPYIVKDWKYWDDINKQKESILRQTKTSTIFRSLMYLIGSVLIIVSKFKKRERITISNRVDALSPKQD